MGFSGRGSVGRFKVSKVKVAIVLGLDLLEQLVLGGDGRRYVVPK